MRLGSAVVIVVLLAGCLGADAPADPSPDGDGSQPRPFSLTYYLKSGHRLATDAPAKSTPDRVPANPMVNGFANEDLRVFASNLTAGTLNVTKVRVIAYYEFVAPSVDPFPNQSNPTQARQIVFWIGSGGIYPASVSTMGDTVLLPGRVYKIEADIVLPKPGWIVAAREPIQLLVATLAPNDRGAEMRFLVDSTDTPSRLELMLARSDLVRPSTAYSAARQFEVLGNSGMFTGATTDRLPSTVRTPIEVRGNDTYLEVRVLFRSNSGGKSDLDFELFAPDGRVAAVSSTPYQSETVRLFAPNLGLFGPGHYMAEIVAYSGTSTKFTVEMHTDSPR